jgi:outer membrane lipoprotein-sorting protein
VNKNWTALLALAPGLVLAADAAAILQRYDQVMGPAYFEGAASMTAHRSDGTERSYDMRYWKANEDKFRTAFDQPATARGQEILRVGDNFWVYMPNLKRAVRLAARESFMGGDFNNADVLRVNYSADYAPGLLEEAPDRWVLELRSKTPSSAYDRIVLTVHKGDYLPLEGRFYAASGKELRSALFEEPRDFHGHRRPSRITMRNSLEPGRWSVMRVLDFRVLPSLPATRFVLTELGK